MLDMGGLLVKEALEHKRQSEEAGISAAYLLSDEFMTIARERAGKENPKFYDLEKGFFFSGSPIGQDVCCPRDGRPGCALVDALPARHRGAATHFLSWSWAYSVGQVRSALTSWLAQKGLEGSEVFLYMCFFVNNQFRILIEQSSTGSDNLEVLFESNLRRIGRVVALLDTWNKPIYLTRAPGILLLRVFADVLLLRAWYKHLINVVQASKGEGPLLMYFRQSGSELSLTTLLYRSLGS